MIIELNKDNIVMLTSMIIFDNSYKKFMNENKKTVMYLVKEFEMKKSAQTYKRASQDKTGIIDPLKLPTYKYSTKTYLKS